MTIQAHFFYSGTVQGVGFRYTMHRFAQDLSLGGWVKNLTDGRVEAVVEGPRSGIDRLQELVSHYFKDEIERVEVTYGEPQGRFTHFAITF